MPQATQPTQMTQATQRAAPKELLYVGMTEQEWMDVLEGLNRSLDIAKAHADEARYGTYGACMEDLAERLTVALWNIECTLPQVVHRYHAEQARLLAGHDPIEALR